MSETDEQRFERDARSERGEGWRLPSIMRPGWWAFRLLLWRMDRQAMRDHRAGLHVRPDICKLCGQEGRFDDR